MSPETPDIKQLEADLQRARELVFQTAKLAEMGKLVAVVVHELSQPLLGIKAFAQILRRRFTEDKFIEPKVRMIEEQAIHMETILASLRHYSRLPQSGLGIVDPLKSVRSAMELFQDRARKLRIQIQLKVPESLPDVRGNHGYIQQVVVNLLSNSLDELEAIKGGLILVHLERVDDLVRLWVADTGRGIADHARERIFEQFYTEKSGEKGTGLGLAICRDILEYLHGDIRLMQPDEVESVLGTGFGAAFEVHLQVASEQE